MKKKHFSRALAVCMTVVFMLCGSILSFAEGGTHSLRVKFITENGPVVDAELRLYAAMTTEEELSGEFASLPVKIGDMTDSENLSRLAYTLASYAASGLGKPVATGMTNALGYVDFENLPEGIYLVTGSSGTIDDMVYTPKPALIRITDTSETMTEASLKYNVAGSGIVRAYTVKKVWNNQEGTANPQSVTVQLFQNGQIFDEITLSAENGWSHRWESLSSDYDWNVIEKEIPAYYAVSITLEGTTFTIENTATGSPEQTETTVSSTTAATTTAGPNATTLTDTTSASGSDSIKTEPPGTNSSDTPPLIEATTFTTTNTTPVPPAPGGNTTTPKLPQTGQLWLPVPILFFAGLVLFLIGCLARSKDKEKDEEGD